MAHKFRTDGDIVEVYAKKLLNDEGAVLIATNHSSIGSVLVLRGSKLLVETPGVYQDSKLN